MILSSLLSPDEASLGEARQLGGKACGGKGWPGRGTTGDPSARCMLSPYETHKHLSHKRGHACPGSLSERTTFFLQGLPSSRASGQRGRLGMGPGDQGRD